MRLFLLSLAVAVLTFPLQAAKFTGPDAEALVPDAAEVIYLGSSVVPAYVRLADGKAQSFDDAEAWLGKHFGLDPRITFAVKTSDSDRYGMKHVRMQQYFDGYPVRGGQYIFHGRDGKWTNANGKLFLPEPAGSPILVSAYEAVGLALDYLPADKYGWELAHPIATYPEAKLTWIAPDLRFEKYGMRLAYAVDVYVAHPLAREIIYIDVATGEKIAAENRIHTNGIPGTAVTRYSGTREIQTSTGGPDGLFVLRDTSRGANIETYNSQRQENPTYIDFTDTDNFWDNVNLQQDEVATDAFWSAEMFYDYLVEQGRNSIDNNGETLEAHVHYGDNIANAFWDGTRTIYGDGSPGTVIASPLTTLEIVGHEFGHGLTNRTSDLIYAGESGGQNEGFSDIIGTYLDFRHNPTTADWRIGSEVDADGEGFRDMEDPRIFGDPRNYEGDNWDAGAGVHTNSGVARHWFYTMVSTTDYVNDFGETYTFRPMAIDTVMEIEYNALVFYMTPSSTYAEGGLATSTAAANLYGPCSEYPARVTAVWAALNVNFTPAGGVFANFTLDGPSVICEIDEPARFVNLSAGETFEWDFGDGTTSTETTPEHTYTEPGVYTVTLTAEGCEGQTDVVTQSVTVDPSALECTAIIFPTNGTVTSTDCEGVIFDSGGPDNEHGNGEEGTVIITNETDSPITLEFVEFSLERSFDFLFIYDGPNENSPLLGAFDGTGPAGDITSTGGAVTLVFRSDGSVTRPGFRIDWSTGAGNAPPNAAVSVSATEVLLGAPVAFTPELVDGPLDFDFGDGTTTSERGTVTHRYLTPGTFEVLVVDMGCSGTDSTTHTITVAEGSQYEINPGSICDTLPVDGSAVHSVTVSNVGDNTGVFGVGQLGDLNREETMRTPITELNQVTEQTFDVPLLLPALMVTLVATGDVTEFGNTATVILEGNEIGTVTGDGGNLLTFTVELSGAELGSYIADGQLDFEIRNAPFVQTFPEGYHEITIGYSLTEWATLDGPADSTLAAGDEAVVTVNLAARALAPGTYESTIDLYTSDADQPVVPYPIKLVVVGTPLPVYSDTLIDLGVVYTNQTETAPLTVNNLGTDVFSVLDIVPGDALLGTDFTDFAVAPYDPVTVTVGFDAPATPGSYAGELTVMTDAGPQLIRVIAEVVEPPVATGVPDSLCFVLASGTSLDTLLTIGNDGVDTLRYTLNNKPENAQSSTVEFDEFDGGSVHLFENVPTDDDLRLEIIILGGETTPGSEVVLRFNPFIPEVAIPLAGSAAGEADTVYFTFPQSELDASGDFAMLVAPPAGSFDEGGTNENTVNLLGSATWLSTSVGSGAVAAGGSFDHPLTIDATELFAGTYRSGLDWTSNDPLIGSRCIPVKLIVTGAADPQLSTDSLDFGEIFLGFERTLPLWVFNRGTADLLVDNLSTDNTRFVVDTTDFTVAPMDSLLVSVTYTPVETVRDNGDLRVSTPDDLLTVALTGVGVEAPDPTFSPDTVCVTLMTGEQEAATVTVANAGPGRLDYRLATEGGSVLLWTPANDDAEVTGLTEAIQNAGSFTLTTSSTQDPAELQQLLSANPVLVLSDHQTFSGEDQLYDVVDGFIEAGGQAVAAAPGNTAQLFERNMLPSASVFDLASNDPLTFLLPDHPLLDGVDQSNLEERPGTRVAVFATEPATEIILGSEFQPTTYVLANNDYGDGGITFLGWNYRVVNEDWSRILQNAISARTQELVLPDWLSLENSSGSLSADETAGIDFNFDATGLAGGTYTFTVPFTVNTPGFPLRNVVAKLIVPAAPVAEFTASAILSCDGIVSFTDQSEFIPTSWSWDFGDGNTSDVANPTHTYTASGNYTVVLEACNELGCDSYVLPNTIEVNLEDEFCLGINFEDGQDQEFVGCGGRIYDQGGPDAPHDNNVNSSILLTSSNGDRLRLIVQSFQLEGCCDFLTIYDGANAGAPIIGSYNGNDLQPGDEMISSGNQLYLTFTTDFSVVFDGFEILWECVANDDGVNIDADNTRSCPATFAMEPTRVDNDMTYAWDFGDGTTGTGAGPHEHTYAATGDYLVRLVMMRGDETFRTQERITVDALNFDISIDMPDGQLVTQTEYTFTVQSDISLNDYFWQLSDGTTSDDGTFTVTFDASTTYTLHLVARGTGTCEGAATETFFVELIDNIEEQASEIGMRMFPNPTVGDFTLELGIPIGYGYQYQVHNPLGQLVMKGQVTGERTTVSACKLTAGAYVLRLFDNDGQLLGGGRFIKQ